jgi:ribosomal protein S27AE
MDRERLELMLAAIEASIHQLQIARNVLAGELESLSEEQPAATCPVCGGSDLAAAGADVVCGDCGATVLLIDAEAVRRKVTESEALFQQALAAPRDGMVPGPTTVLVGDVGAEFVQPKSLKE